MSNGMGSEGSVLAALSQASAAVVEAAGRSLVRVEGRRRMAASGIVWSANGLIVTSNHVVERDDNLQVGLPDGSTLAATLAGRDPSTDVALLRVEASALTPAQWVDAGDLRVGNFVLALGRPGRTVQATLGIVSGLGGAWRTGGGGEVDRYLQTDVVMYPGFSGGALVEAGGRFAGMNSSALMRGVSLTLPAATLRRVVETLSAHGQMPRGYLGLGVQPVRLTDGLAPAAGQETGLMVMSVEAGGPAATGGLMQGDVLLTLDGQPTRHVDELQALLGAERAGKQVAVRLVRGGSTLETQVTLGRK
jgi:S1-C subfamily serine protease